MQSIWGLPWGIFTKLQCWSGTVFYTTGLLLFCFIWSYRFEHHWDHYGLSLTPSVLCAETSHLGLQLDLHINMLEVEQNQNSYLAWLDFWYSLTVWHLSWGQLLQRSVHHVKVACWLSCADYIQVCIPRFGKVWWKREQGSYEGSFSLIGKIIPLHQIHLDTFTEHSAGRIRHSLQADSYPL